MKTIFQKFTVLWIVLLSVSNLLAVTPTGSYQPSQKEDNQRTAVMATAPSSQFQSTSTLQGVGSSYSSAPTLSEDGTVPSPTGPRYAPKPINNDDDWKEREGSIGSGISTPVGDAVLPLTLLALAYIGFTAFRRRKALKR